MEMPIRFKGIGAKKEDIDQLIVKLHENVGDTFGHFKSLSMEDARQIFLLACDD